MAIRSWSCRQIKGQKSLGIGLAILTTMVLFGPSGSLRENRGQSRQLQQSETVNAWPSKAKRWALVIGVDQYADAQITSLRGAANDAKTLADALVRYAGFPQNQVILLATDQPAERQPTRAMILRRLSNLAAVVPKDGLLLVSFAGHGIERDRQAFLIPSDAQLADDVALLEDSAISVNKMKDRIRAIGVGQVVVLLDACRNDPGGRADAPNPLTEAYLRAFDFDVRNREVQAFATIYATAVGKRAYEYTEKKQGYFTWAVVEALKGSAANAQGEVTLSEMVRYVQEVVPRQIAIDLGRGKEQRPFAIVEGYRANELVIAVNNPTTALPKSEAVLPAPGNNIAIELSYWETIKNSSDPEDFKSYLQKYPDGQFSDLAKRRAVSTTARKEENERSSATFVTSRVSVRSDNLNNGWTNSGVRVRIGQRLRISALGRISLGPLGYSGPVGLSSVSDNLKLMRNQATGALIAVIGDDNDDFIYVGEKLEFVAQRNGILFLGVNEGNLNDNTGTYEVVIEAEAD